MGVVVYSCMRVCVQVMVVVVVSAVVVVVMVVRDHTVWPGEGQVTGQHHEGERVVVVAGA